MWIVLKVYFSAIKGPFLTTLYCAKAGKLWHKCLLSTSSIFFLKVTSSGGGGEASRLYILKKPLTHACWVLTLESRMLKKKIWVLLWQSSLSLSLKPPPPTQWWAAVAAVPSHITLPTAGTAGQCGSSAEGGHTQAETNTCPRSMCSPAVLNAVPEIQWQD